MMDFKIEQEIVPVIQVNFEEMKQALSKTMEQYTGIIVTEESLGACKEEQRHLASMRTRIDNYRKDKKKELSKPITDFENQCKELIALIEKAEKPIKAGISVFDDKKREGKKKEAEKIIQETVELHQIKKKFADKLTVLDKYMNLTATTKAVREDIEQRAFALVEEQAKEEEMIEVVKTTIENENKTLKTKIAFEEFAHLIDVGTPIPHIMQRVNQMAAKIREAENPAPAPEPDPTPSPIADMPIMTGSIAIDEPIPDPERYFIEFRVEGPAEHTKALGDFLRNRGIKYTVLNKGRL